jgi:hypothetical protein
MALAEKFGRSDEVFLALSFQRVSLMRFFGSKERP